MKKIFIITTLLVVVYGCNTPAKQKEEKPLMDQVMDLHDEVMPKMGDLMKTSKALLMKADVSPDSAKLKSLAKEIDDANESMMQWMRNFDPNFSGTEEEVKAYLLKKKEGIQKVANDMNATLEAGRKALN